MVQDQVMPNVQFRVQDQLMDYILVPVGQKCIDEPYKSLLYGQDQIMTIQGYNLGSKVV